VNDCPLIEVVLDGLVAVIILLSAATVIAMAAAFASLIGHVAGIVHEPGATVWLFATSGISFAVNYFVGSRLNSGSTSQLRLIPLKRRGCSPSRAGPADRSAPNVRFRI
jgi:hypothetical protein